MFKHTLNTLPLLHRALFSSLLFLAKHTHTHTHTHTRTHTHSHCCHVKSQPCGGGSHQPAEDHEPGMLRPSVRPSVCSCCSTFLSASPWRPQDASAGCTGKDYLLPKTERASERASRALSPAERDRRKPAHLARPSPGMQSAPAGSSGVTDGVHTTGTGELRCPSHPSRHMRLERWRFRGVVP